ncbi:SoxR reducing system RseC family protein [Kordiimonas aquimaris]|uniref:SoxR reducing system RseC family protein n=1 Tax=Kordiimonas aquimaris TaxID=707591 RepID=UPI0021CE2B37|nr:SoxR reducing system RseC family protein [Kordiimonas aquimaris]
MYRRPTVTGFFVFAGLIAGAVLGQWLPFLASIEAIAGGVIGGLLGFVIDKAAANKEGDTSRKPEDN